jgi:hypothetical protein
MRFWDSDMRSISTLNGLHNTQPWISNEKHQRDAATEGDQHVHND